MTTLQAALTGVLFGGLYALMAAGVSVTWGVLRVINLAHFGLILLGAYLTFELRHVVADRPAGQPAGDRAGAVRRRRRCCSGASTASRSPSSTRCWSASGCSSSWCRRSSNIWTADFQRMTARGQPVRHPLRVRRPAGLPGHHAAGFALAVALIVGAHLALRRTFTGRAMRAFAQDRTVAAAFGIDHRRVGILLAGVAGASAAVAGMLVALSSALTPATAFEWFGTVFAVVILGGIGHVAGTLVAGLLVGALSAVVSVLASPAAAPFVLFSMIILVLLLRPQGLFARAVRIDRARGRSGRRASGARRHYGRGPSRWPPPRWPRCRCTGSPSASRCSIWPC